MKKIRLSELSKKISIPVIKLAKAINEQYGVALNPMTELEESHVQFLLETFAIPYDKIDPAGMVRESLSDNIQVLSKKLNLLCLRFDIKGQIRHYVVDKSKNKILGTPGENIFTSVVPSVATEPLLLTVNRITDLGYERGILRVDGDKLNEIIPIGTKYDFIDGVDHGLARVYVKDDNARYHKRWGIIRIEGNSFSEVLALKYENIWNFYDKGWAHVRVEDGDKTEDVDLMSLRLQQNDENSIIDVEGLSRDDVEKEFDKKIKEGLTKLRGVSLENFKCFHEEINVSFDKYINIIVGKNNSGKSSCLNALERASLFFPKASLSQAFKVESVENNDDCFANIHNKWDKSDKVTVSVIVGPCRFTVDLKNSIIPNAIRIEHIHNNILFVCEQNKISLADGRETITMEIDGSDEDSTLSGLIKKFKLEHQNELNWSKDKGLRLNSLREIEICLEGLNRVTHIGVFSAQKSEISEIAKQIKNKDHAIHKFVRKWIRRMEIGDNYQIGDDGGVSVYDEFGDMTDLASMGTGSKHIVILLMKIANIIFDEDKKENHFPPIILIEEPEQNLHPMLQSRLADFFADAAVTYCENRGNVKNATFIVETHSEYLVRKTQVIAKQKGEDNPFTITYFPSRTEGIKPYKMYYRDNGRLDPDFLPGFTDESFSLTLKLI